MQWAGICQCWVALLRRCTQPTTLYSIPDSQADCHAPFLLFLLSLYAHSGGSQRRNARHRETQSNTQKARRLPADVKGRLPRPLPVVSAFALCSQRGLATTKRTSPRGTKRSPCWHSPSSLLAASGRLGGAASGRYHVVIFKKRNPTKCSRRVYVSIGLRSCVAAPNLRLNSQKTKADCRAPSLWFNLLDILPAGARKDEIL